jgi:hypothetical protein
MTLQSKPLAIQTQIPHVAEYHILEYFNMKTDYWNVSKNELLSPTEF